MQCFGSSFVRIAAILCLWTILLSAPPDCTAQSNTISHRFRFFIHPDLTQGLSDQDVKSRLSLYVEDLNLIFSKNTLRRFTFDPDNDLTITDSPPQTGYYSGDLPMTNYEIWAIVNPAASTPYNYSHGGYMSFATTNGAGVATGMYWDAIHDRNALVNDAPDDWDLWNYWIQIHNTAHELGHVYGAASGEYYSLRNVHDTTGIAPLQDVFYPDTGPTTDPYWSQHPDYWYDPMIGWTPRLMWHDLTNQVQFARVTAAMINAGFRMTDPEAQVPDLSKTRIWVRAEGTQIVIPGAHVEAWKIMAAPPWTPTLVFDGSTGPGGFIEFDWTAEGDNWDNMMVMKAWPDTANPVVRWFSFYDAQEQRMVYGNTNLNIYLDVNPVNLLTIQSATNAILISWPTNAAGFALETSSSLSSMAWSPVTLLPLTNGALQTVTWPVTNDSQFFRLRRN